MENETRLIAGGIVLTMNNNDDMLTDGAVLVENGRIADIGPSAELLSKYAGVEVLDAAGQVIMPGLVNLHLHSGLIRGTAEDLPVFEWLHRYVDPKHRALQQEEAYAAARLSYAEGIKSGTTSVLDMYRHVHRCADAADEIGVRAVFAPYVADRPGYDYFETLESNIRLIEDRNGSAQGRIHVWVGLEHLSYCTEEAYREAARIAEKWGTGIHTHGEESIEMAKEVYKNYGRWPVELFYDRGILGPRTVLAHCVWMQESEMELMAKTGAAVAHCPVSNLKLASGIAPIHEMAERGIKIGIGTDGVKENNNLDMMEEMKYVPLLQKVRHYDAKVMKADKVLRMATIDGAKALGQDGEIGSIELGKKADIITVDFRKLHLTPVLTQTYNNIVSNLVYSAQGSDVQNVMVDGKLLMKDRVLTTVDEEQVRQAGQYAAEQLLERREAFIPEQYKFHGV
ncbi:amidohydrolase family protein [Paenibacillus sp. 2TAB19]|uniref:amidohydrolase family protein n=1 Tax=Paenibacillus sp. 2TAB19 TaxID=3233003 RepID=UPI003F951558